MTHIARVVPRPLGLRRGVVALVLALLAVAASGVLVPPAMAAGPRAHVSPQALVVLLSDHVVFARPHAKAPRIGSVQSLRPLTHVRTVLPVLGRATSFSGKPWVRVRLPGRPNSRTGWIPARRTRRASTGWHISLKLSTRRVTVYNFGRPVRRFRAVVGKPSTPTPRGRFFIEEALTIGAHAGGPFALATSARSSVLQEFEGGPGQIALHGTRNLWGPLGSAASHGCIRLSTAAITWLAHRIRGGVPLTIRR